jgi:hypothetical protein
MTTVPGDPASTSVLGGALRRHALTVLRAHELLEQACRRATRRGAADPAPRERELLTSTAEQLDRIGTLLQAWATNAAESSARVRAIADAAARSDLYVDGHHVLEAAGPSRADPAARLATREHLQQLLNRVTAQDAKARGRLQRELEASAAALARTSERARLGGD